MVYHDRSAGPCFCSSQLQQPRTSQARSFRSFCREHFFWPLLKRISAATNGANTVASAANENATYRNSGINMSTSCGSNPRQLQWLNHSLGNDRILWEVVQMIAVTQGKCDGTRAQEHRSLLWIFWLHVPFCTGIIKVQQNGVFFVAGNL